MKHFLKAAVLFVVVALVAAMMMGVLLGHSPGEAYSVAAKFLWAPEPGASIVIFGIIVGVVITNLFPRKKRTSS